MSVDLLPPPMMWAQRSELIYLTVTLEDIEKPFVKYEENSVYFKGNGGVDKKMYEVTIPLYKSIEPEKCKTINKERCVEMILAKKDHEQPYWPSLTLDKKKHHWLKIDFNKWKDEEESETEQNSGNLSDVTLDAYDGDEDETEAPQLKDEQVLNVEAE